MKEFKVGDKVYCPALSTEVKRLVKSVYSPYPLALIHSGRCFTMNGESSAGCILPSIFHATQENRELLQKLYGIEFEAPPLKTVSVTLEVPEPFEPKLHEMYWYLDNCGEVDFSTLNTDLGDKHIKFKWRTKEEAKQALKMFNATFGIPE